MIQLRAPPSPPCRLTCAVRGGAVAEEDSERPPRLSYLLHQGLYDAPIYIASRMHPHCLPCKASPPPLPTPAALSPSAQPAYAC